MRVFILGATGRTGKQLLTVALAQGYQVTVLVRDRQKIGISSGRLTVIESPALDADSLQRAVVGCDAVISTLNISRTSDFPWAPLRTPPTFLSDLLTRLLPICEEQNVRRLIVVTAWGTNETKKDIPFWFRWLIDYSNIGVAYRDHERQEKLLRQSNLDWTIIRPVGLTNGESLKPVIETIDNQPKPNLTISRRNVARFMLDVLRNNQYVRQAVTISEP
ncbi:NAD(P)-dependent oxidoreductase [Spirosoma rhododendri]|uniref:SDR family oxidoreductase n=1 Tax=Spirosoma rhododendri TaxID=2728024 RepID=A0A7L5DUL0_9BACT|nr:SDR family oxidoreductase [Spirosoma rhododendri]QJD81161.1 SDR family oxidoreductase [Spirosoma rhododendri]